MYYVNSSLTAPARTEKIDYDSLTVEAFGKMTYLHVLQVQREQPSLYKRLIAELEHQNQQTIRNNNRRYQ